MASAILNLANSLPLGVTFNFEPPCVGNDFPKDVLMELVQKQLPSYMTKLKQAWAAIPNGQVSGFAPRFQSNLMDNCGTKGRMGRKTRCATQRDLV